ncbi:bifunctional DNA primase/polymerase, partial [Mesorhizobium sp. M1A.F.Ca.IN.020.06.1.1]|uniref:bifunctional DNA primase/polymerase n=1 Tax=Mesorhizobium sp. M1A.F.Ca.IN.020.06.1.1 TaxID=2496765 RepID=UPI0013E2FC57
MNGRAQASKLQIAVAYAKRLGWSVGPLLPDKKIPPFKDWWNKTTNDPDRLADFWSPERKLIGETRKGKPVYSNPDYNIGLDTEKSGVICIDCDEKDGKHGIAALRNLAAEQGVELGPDADVFMTRSASGGVHAYFEGEPVQSKNSVC